MGDRGWAPRSSASLETTRREEFLKVKTSHTGIKEFGTADPGILANKTEIDCVQGLQCCAIHKNVNNSLLRGFLNS